MSHNKIDTIVFDFGYTLAHFTPSRVERCLKVLQKLGFNHSEKEIVNVYDCIDQTYPQKASQIVTEADKERYYDNYNELLAKGLRVHSEREKFNILMQEEFSREKQWLIFDDVVPTLEALNKNKIKLYILANWDKSLREKCERNNIEKFFSGIYSSWEIGVDKPDPEIFFKFINMTMIDPQKAKYVGDSYTLDVIPSRQAGFKAVLLNRSEHFESHSDCVTITSLMELLEFI